MMLGVTDYEKLKTLDAYLETANLRSVGSFNQMQADAVERLASEQNKEHLLDAQKATGVKGSLLGSKDVAAKAGAPADRGPRQRDAECGPGIFRACQPGTGRAK